MKCDNCFFCVHIGRSIYAEYPVKYCKYHKKYFLPFVETQDNGGTARPLNFNDMKDLKMWSSDMELQSLPSTFLSQEPHCKLFREDNPQH